MSVNLGNLVVNLGMDTAQMVKGIARANRSMDGLVAKAKKVGQQTRAMGLGLSASITAPIAAVALFSIKAAAQLETMEVAFESMLGSAEHANNLMGQLTEFSAKTPFQINDLAKAGKILLAFNEPANQLINTLGFLGDVSAGTNVPIGEMTQIFGKVMAKGKAMTEELLQMSERGVPVLDELAKQAGVTKGEIFKMAEKSQISADMVRKALINMTSEGGIFFKQMERQSRTLAGIWSTLKDNVFLLAAEFGNMISETVNLKELMGEIIKKAQEGAKWFKELDKSVKQNIIAALAFAASIGPILIVLGTLISLSASAVGALAAIAGSTVIGPIILLAVALTTIVIALRTIGKEAKKSQFELSEMARASKKEAESANLTWIEQGRAIDTVWQNVTENVKHLWNSAGLVIARVFDTIIQAMLTSIENVSTGIKEMFKLAEKGGLLSRPKMEQINQSLTPDFSKQREMGKQLEKMQNQEDARHRKRMNEINRVFLGPVTDADKKNFKKTGGGAPLPGGPPTPPPVIPTNAVEKFAGAIEFGSLQDFRIRRGLLSREDKIQKENVDANKKTADNTKEAKEILEDIRDNLGNNNTVGIT